MWYHQHEFFPAVVDGCVRPSIWPMASSPMMSGSRRCAGSRASVHAARRHRIISARGPRRNVRRNSTKGCLGCKMFKYCYSPCYYKSKSIEISSALNEISSTVRSSRNIHYLLEIWSSHYWVSGFRCRMATIHILGGNPVLAHLFTKG